MKTDYAYIRCYAILKALLKNIENKKHHKTLVDVLTMLETEGRVDIPYLDIMLTSSNVFYYSHIRNILRDVISSENSKRYTYTAEMYKNTKSVTVTPFSKLKRN